jgi:deferrochelatase/peroxidase EfeB
MAEINEVVEWIYGDGETASIEEYRPKLDKFQKIGEPVKQRHFYYSELDIYFKQIEDLCVLISSRAATVEHITAEQTDLINKKMGAAKEFFAKVQADRVKKQLFENPEFALDQLIGTISLLKAETEAIFAAVKPPKKETPEKKEEPEKKDDKAPGAEEEVKKEGEDVEMKNEEVPAAAEDKKTS